MSLSAEGKRKLIRWGKTLLKIGVAALAFKLIYESVGKDELKGAIQRMNWGWVVLAVLVYFLSQAISSVRFQIFLRWIGIRIPQLENFKLYLLGTYYNLALPGGVGGDGYKVYLLNKRTGARLKPLGWSSVLDRASGLVSIFILMTCFGLLIPWTYPLINDWLWLGLPALLIGNALILKLFFPLYWIPSWRALPLSLVVQLMQVGAAMIFALALGVEDHFPAYIVAFLVSSVATIIPITPGGIGVREFTALYLAPELNIDPTTAVLISLFFNLSAVLFGLIGMYFSFRKPALEPIAEGHNFEECAFAKRGGSTRRTTPQTSEAPLED